MVHPIFFMSKISNLKHQSGLLNRIINVCAAAAGILICGLVVLIVADITSRNFLLFAMPWSFDVAEYSLFFITFLGAPWVLREEGHITVDILVARLSPSNQIYMARVANAIGGLVC
jgi:C4-dicarboxylate transporter DctQ subunit